MRRQKLGLYIAVPKGLPRPIMVVVRQSAQQQSRLRCHMLVADSQGKPVQVADVRLEQN